MKTFILLFIVLFFMGCSSANLKNDYQNDGPVYYSQGEGKTKKIRIVIKTPVLKTETIEEEINNGK